MSNAHVGADFERVALEFFAQEGIALSRNFAVEIGLSKKKKHCFDLGTAKGKILVECKSHRWTAGARVPSAKMTVWNEAMYYFHLAPMDYRKILFVLHDRRERGGRGTGSDGQPRRRHTGTVAQSPSDSGPGHIQHGDIRSAAADLGWRSTGRIVHGGVAASRPVLGGVPLLVGRPLTC